MTTTKLKLTCAALLLAGTATWFAGCTKEESSSSSSSSSSSNSSSFIPNESAVMAKLKNFSFASTGTTTTSEAQKILTFLGSDVDIHTITSVPGAICGEYKSGYHLALLPGGAAYAAYYGDEDDHSFLTTAGRAFTIDPSTAGGSGGGGGGGSSYSCTSNSGFGNYNIGSKKYTNATCISYSTLSYGCTGKDVRLGDYSNSNYLKISNMPAGTGYFKINDFLTCGNCDLYITDENSSGSVSGFTLFKKTSTCFSFTCKLKDGAGLEVTVSGEGNYK